MKTEDRALLESGKFDRDAWAALWDRLPVRTRRLTAEFVLHKLHAIESVGNYSDQFDYVTAGPRAAATDTDYTDTDYTEDEPLDIIKFRAKFQFGRS